jgi:hypothetical protein
MHSKRAAPESNVLPEQVAQKVELGQRLRVTSVVVHPLHLQRLEGQIASEKVLWSMGNVNAEAC